MNGSKTRFRVEQDGEMEIFRGFSPVPSPPVVGRLVWGRRWERTHGACLRVYTKEILSQIDGIECEGIVAVGNQAFSGERLARLSCPILMLPELPERCIGKIAVLDAAQGRLFVSPDLSTLARYSAQLKGIELSEELMGNPTVRADGICLTVGQEKSGGFYARQSGYFLDLSELERENESPEECVYEYCCDFADFAAGTSVTVALRATPKESDERLRAALRGVFRAAVYGNFSVMVEGCLTEEDARTVRRAHQHAFCELASEGREFNGYIPKGLLIENLLYPISSSTCEGWDFFCLDAKRLSECLTGRPWSECSAWEQEWQTVGASLLSVCGGRGALWVRMPESISPRLLCRAFLQAGVGAWIFPQESGVGTRRYLREIWESTPEENQNLFPKR